MRKTIAIAFVVFSCLSAQAQVKRIPLPDNSTFPISQGVWVRRHENTDRRSHPLD